MTEVYARRARIRRVGPSAGGPARKQPVRCPVQPRKPIAACRQLSPHGVPHPVLNATEYHEAEAYIHRPGRPAWAPCRLAPTWSGRGTELQLGGQSRDGLKPSCACDRKIPARRERRLPVDRTRNQASGNWGIVVQEAALVVGRRADEKSGHRNQRARVASAAWAAPGAQLLRLAETI